MKLIELMFLETRSWLKVRLPLRRRTSTKRKLSAFIGRELICSIPNFRGLPATAEYDWGDSGSVSIGRAISVDAQSGAGVSGRELLSDDRSTDSEVDLGISEDSVDASSSGFDQPITYPTSSAVSS